MNKDQDHLAAAPEQRGELPEPAAWLVCSVNGDGSLMVEHSTAWEQAAHDHINDAINEYDIEDAATWVVRPAHTADQLRTAIAAERERNTAAHLACGHPAELMLRSAETGAPLYCELCDDKAGRRDAEKRESELQAELSTLRQQLAEAVRDAKRYRWLRRIDSFAEWNRVGHYAADALDAAIDAAIAAQGEAKPPGVERELFEGE